MNSQRPTLLGACVLIIVIKFKNNIANQGADSLMNQHATVAKYSI